MAVPPPKARSHMRHSVRLLTTGVRPHSLGIHRSRFSPIVSESPGRVANVFRPSVQESAYGKGSFTLDLRRKLVAARTPDGDRRRLGLHPGRSNPRLRGAPGSGPGALAATWLNDLGRMLLSGERAWIEADAEVCFRTRLCKNVGPAFFRRIIFCRLNPNRKNRSRSDVNLAVGERKCLKNFQRGRFYTASNHCGRSPGRYHFSRFGGHH